MSSFPADSYHDFQLNIDCDELYLLKEKELSVSIVEFVGSGNIVHTLLRAKPGDEKYLKKILKSEWFKKDSDNEKYVEKFCLSNNTKAKKYFEDIAINVGGRANGNNFYQFCPENSQLTVNQVKPYSAKKEAKLKLKGGIPTYKYSKCLSRRKADFVGKLIKAIQAYEKSTYYLSAPNPPSVHQADSNPRIQADVDNGMTRKRKLPNETILSQQSLLHCFDNPNELVMNSNYILDNSSQSAEMNSKRFKMSPMMEDLGSIRDSIYVPQQEYKAKSS